MPVVKPVRPGAAEGVAPDGTQVGANWSWPDAGRWVLWLMAVLVVLLAVRIVALRFNATDLFFDEAQYWSWSLEPAFGYYSKPPMIAWLIGLATSVCGHAEFCVRLPSPIIHTLTACAVFVAAAALYGARIGFLSAVVFATLPGVSFSAGLISTDVPLLLFWAIALAAFVGLVSNRQAWWPAVVLGLALGLGLNAKYAMAYFVLCALIHVAATPEKRWILRDPRWWVAVAIGIAMIAPNLIWNLNHSFATFAHTADNAKWSGSLVHPGKALEFFAAQFGVFGPILFGALLVIAGRAYRFGLPPADRLLLSFALPVVVIITVQAFLSRAHANWAAVSYVAATILVTATMVRDLAWRWLAASLALHVALLVGFGAALTQARSLAVPGGNNPFARVLGWAEVAEATRARLARARAAGRPYGAVVALDRSIAAELLYYLRDANVPVLAMPARGRPRDHFQLTRPLETSSPGPYLIVAEGHAPEAAMARFERVGAPEAVSVKAGVGASRTIVFIEAGGLREASPASSSPAKDG